MGFLTRLKDLYHKSYKTETIWKSVIYTNSRLLGFLVYAYQQYLILRLGSDAATNYHYSFLVFCYKILFIVYNEKSVLKQTCCVITNRINKPNSKILICFMHWYATVGILQHRILTCYGSSSNSTNDSIESVPKSQRLAQYSCLRSSSRRAWRLILQ